MVQKAPPQPSPVEEDSGFLMINFSDLGQIALITSLLEKTRVASENTKNKPTEDSSTLWSGIRGDFVVVEAELGRIELLAKRLEENKNATTAPLVALTTEEGAPLEAPASLSEIKIRRITRTQAAGLIDWNQFGDGADEMKTNFKLNVKQY